MFAIRAGAEGDITPKDGEMTGSGVEWIFPDAGLGNASPLLYDGLIYIIGGRGDIICVNAVGGALVYKTRLRGAGAIWASPWVFNDKICFFDEKRVTRIIKAGEKYELLSQNTLDDKFWSSVAIAGDAYIFKGAEKLYCVKE
ncbi:MAG: PQQ-binding-like beta-propeller repeat protein [Bacteroidales bacterium]|nr:PQQ-binding-like beta-propeller repeat protein [Bacteroidales bacterium]